MREIVRNIISSNKKISLLGLTLSLLIATSCDKYLDEVPDNRVALNNLDKASQLLTNAYSIAAYQFTDWMTDDVGYTRGVNLRTIHDPRQNKERPGDQSAAHAMHQPADVRRELLRSK